MADVDEIKQANKLEDVIETSGYQLITKRGRYLKAREHDSLVIDTEKQYYVWNSRSEKGDVITWLEQRNKWDFKTAVEWLANRANLTAPNWGREDNAARVAARAKEDALTVAARVFAQRFQKSETATAYARSRGWTDETMRGAMLGFTGGGTQQERKELEGELTMNGAEPGSGAWKAVLGMPEGMLVYPHEYGGRVKYLSCRSIEGKRHYNLPKDLVGERQVYFNQAYAPRAEEVVLVEGQADAVTLGQWGVAAVALAGVSFDQRETIEGVVKGHATVYLGLDQDEGGVRALLGVENDWPLVELLGPMARVIRWEAGERGGKIKDANDWLKWMMAQAIPAENQVKLVRGALDGAQPIVLSMAMWAGQVKGAAQDAAVKRVFGVIGKMDKMMAAKYRERLAAGLNLGLREFNNMLKTAQGEAKTAEKETEQVVETLGGAIGGWLLEYLYDEGEGEASLAFRDPDGKIDTAPYVDIDGVRYMPLTPNSLVRNKGVLFPSKLAGLKPTRELVGIIESFIHKYYLLDDRFFGRLAAYYVLLTWLHDCFNAIPYLRAMGDYGSGKSELMKRIGHVCYRMMSTGGAGTAASLFRALDQYRGTAFMDEMDLADGGDMANDLVKILNMGAMANSPIWRMEEFVKGDGTRGYDVKGYNIFGPKLIAMRKDFRDQAVASRCLTVKLMAKEPIELRNAGVPLHIDNEFYEHALSIRNLLLRWRLAKWQPEIPVTEELMDLEVPARLNQVTMPIKAIALDDPELMQDITRFVRGLNEELILERSMGLDARVLDALVAILEGEKYKTFCLTGEVNGMGTVKYVYAKYVSKVANELIDEMNLAEGEEGEEEEKRGRKPRGTTSQTVGKVARQTLQLKVYRKNAGYVIVYDAERIQALKVKYGLMRIDDRPKAR